MAPIVSSSGGVSPSPGSEETIFGVPKWAMLAATGGLIVAGVVYYVLKDPRPKKKGECFIVFPIVRMKFLVVYLRKSNQKKV